MPLMPHIYAHKESNAFIQNIRDAMTTIVELTATTSSAPKEDQDDRMALYCL